ncbi:MAG TPA: hypothetical protein VFP87_06035 [Chitinophagaceae bacterium]|nr:hypothetical protein [Chitinophagaceae bacterium]
MSLTSTVPILLGKAKHRNKFAPGGLQHPHTISSPLSAESDHSESAKASTFVIYKVPV